METETHVLEINLISAQGLKTPAANLRRTQTYALVWIDSSNKLRSRVDRIGGENPTWNDRFLFRVSPDFITGETSGVSVQIFSVGCVKDVVVGTARFLLSSCLSRNAAVSSSGEGIGTPSFTAVHIQRPSGRFHGVLNIAAAVHDGSGPEFGILEGLPAVCFRELMGEKENDGKRQKRLSRCGSKRSEKSSGGESCDLELSSLDLSDGADSTTSSSSTASNALKDWNGCCQMAGKGVLKSNGVGLLCGLVLQRKIPRCPSDQNLHYWAESFEKEG